MLNFEFNNPRSDVYRALSSRLNHTCMDGLRHQDRKVQRTNFCEVVWLIPPGDKGYDYSQAVPAVSRDLSVQGFSLIHNAALADSELVVGIPGVHGFNFFHCKVQHCSDLGYGFFQIGLFASKVITPSRSQLTTWEKRAAEFAQKASAEAEPVA